jgi:hypothetical protein
VVPSSLPTPPPPLHVGMTLSGVPIDPWFAQVTVGGVKRPAFVISPKARPHSLRAGTTVSLEDGSWSRDRVLRELRRVRKLEWPSSVPGAIVGGLVMATLLTLVAAGRLVFAVAIGVTADPEGASALHVLASAALLYFGLGLVLGTLVGFALPFVRDRDAAKFLGVIVGATTFASFVPMVLSEERERSDLLVWPIAVAIGALIGRAVASATWDEDETSIPPRGVAD